MEIMLIKIILYIGIMLSSIICGLLLSKLCWDELKSKKSKYYLSLVFLLIFLGLIISLIFYKKIEIILSLFYFLIIVIISFYKSGAK